MFGQSYTVKELITIDKRKINRFIKPILDKNKPRDFKANKERKELIKMINHTSPSFNMMLEIHEFLVLLTDIYMYDNNEKFHLFLGVVNSKKISDNTFAMVYKGDGFLIKFVLVADWESGRHQIKIEITRGGQNKNNIEKIEFYDGEYQFKDEYDKEKMRFIISCLMNGVVELVNYYYENKAF